MSVADTSRDRPEFEVRADGSALERDVHRDVVAIDVHEEVNRHARLALVLQNWDQDTRTVRHSDDGPLTPGVGIEVLMGYHSDLTSVFDGVVTSVTAQFPRTGRPVLRVEARSRSVLLDFPARSRQLSDASDADVASAIAADHSLQVDASDGITRAAVVIDRTSDWEYLRGRAEELGWVAFVRGTTLVMRPPADPPGSPLRLEYTRDLVEAHLTQDVSRAPGEVTGAGWDVASVDEVQADAGASRSGIGTGSRPDHAAAASDTGWALRDARVASPAWGAADDVDARAVGVQRRSALAHVHGTGVVVGQPALRCDTWVEVLGVGRRLSGQHYVTAARHRLSASGYTTEFQVGLPRPLVPPATPRGGSGTAGRASLVLGVVEALDDPESANRVKVRLPWRGDSGEGVWARVSAPDAGSGYGAVLIPDVGQEVLVGHVDGDPSAPVVLGCLYNGTQAPPVTIDPDRNAVRTVVTPAGHRVVLDDGDASGVTVETADGHTLVLSDADSALSLTHGASGNAITVSADGIELSAAQGDIVLTASSGAVKLDAATLEGKATGPSSIESSATLDLKASASLGLTGSLVTIN